MIKAVIFDLDGVLRDSARVNIRAAEKSFKKLGIEIDEEDRKVIVGRHPDDYTLILRKKYVFDVERYKEIKSKSYFELLKKAELLPFANDVLERLRRKGIKLALATSSLVEGTYDFFINKFGLEGFFNVVVTFEDCLKRKPEPEIYLKVLEKLGLPANECAVVEDTVVGIEAAKKAGIKCIAIPNEYTKNQDFSEADFVVSSLAELKMELLEKLGET